MPLTRTGSHGRRVVPKAVIARSGVSVDGPSTLVRAAVGEANRSLRPMPASCVSSIVPRLRADVIAKTIDPRSFGQVTSTCPITPA